MAGGKAGHEQRETVRREFSKQASNFEASRSLFRDGGILGRIAAHIDVPASARILDVAGGTGQLGRHVAGDGATAVIVDLTDAMLTAGLRSVEEQGLDDVAFVRGDATDLPFRDDQFDVVVSRFALHHMDGPAAAIAEMVRVCRPDGSVTLIDLVAAGPRHDELERLRDPSHTGHSRIRSSGHCSPAPAVRSKRGGNGSSRCRSSRDSIRRRPPRTPGMRSGRRSSRRRPAAGRPASVLSAPTD